MTPVTAFHPSGSAWEKVARTVTVSGTAVTDAIEATVVLKDWVSRVVAESAALDLNSIVSNGTLASFVSTNSSAFQVLQVLER